MTKHRGHMIGDPLVVAAFNSCIDLEKWNGLPSGVKERFKELLRCNRLKWVCFSDELGIGLRVYRDQGRWEYSGDEAEVAGTQEDAVTDLGGHWVRCPKEKWAEFIAEAEKPVYLVGDKAAKRFYQRWTPDLAEDDYDEEDFTLAHENDLKYRWAPRYSGTSFTDRAEAESLAGLIGGIVVEEQG